MESPISWQGKSLLNEIKKDRAFFFCPYSEFLFGTRNKNWKLIFNASNNSFELYDLSTDPNETTNLASKYPDKVREEYVYISAWVQMHDKIMKNHFSNLTY